MWLISSVAYEHKKKELPRPATVKNIGLRGQLYRAEKKKKKKEKKILKRKKGSEAEGTPKKIPRTIENTRLPDETMVTGEDTEVMEETQEDEFSEYYRDGKDPKTLITTNMVPTQAGKETVEAFINVFPNSEYRPRGSYKLRDIIKYCIQRDYTDVMVINEDHKEVNGLLVIHLPNGPTAHFKMSSWKSHSDIAGSAAMNSNNPELILNNFNTRLGHSVGRMLGALFPHTPDFDARTVVTFHNQRDFIFFRQHRYIGEKKVKKEENSDSDSDSGFHRARPATHFVDDFDEEPPKPEKVLAARTHSKGTNSVTIHEMGPRFTLKLKSIQKGTLDFKGEYIWVAKKELDQSRKRFFL